VIRTTVIIKALSNDAASGVTSIVGERPIKVNPASLVYLPVRAARVIRNRARARDSKEKNRYLPALSEMRIRLASVLDVSLD